MTEMEFRELYKKIVESESISDDVAEKVLERIITIIFGKEEENGSG